MSSASRAAWLATDEACGQWIDRDAPAAGARSLGGRCAMCSHGSRPNVGELIALMSTVRDALGSWRSRGRTRTTALRGSWSDRSASCMTRPAARSGSPRQPASGMVGPPAHDEMPEPRLQDRAAPGRWLTLFPADDRRFRDAVLMAVELFPASTDGQVTPSSPRLPDDERSRAAAQTMLRGAYPMATILDDHERMASHAGAWQVFRDPASLDGALLRAARPGRPDVVTRRADLDDLR